MDFVTAFDAVSPLHATITLVMTLFAPFLISAIKDPRMSAAGKQVVVLLVSLGLGALSAFLSGDLDAANLIGSAGVIATLAQSVYKVYFKDTVINGSLEQMSLI